MLKIGILGMGGMGWFHASRYFRMPDAQLVAIADIEPQRLRAERAIQINLEDGQEPQDLSALERYPSARELLAEADVDVVDICLPTDLHAEYTIAALERGCHVLCEKPMALNVVDADRMIAAAEQNDRRLMVAHVLRFWPEYLFLQQMVRDESYGALRSLNMWRMGGRPRWSTDNWFLEPERSGGVLLDLHIHDVDYVNALWGQPDTLSASARDLTPVPTCDVIHATFTYESGPQVHMHAGWSAAQIPFQAGYEAWFERAFLRYAQGKLELFADPQEVAGQEVDYARGDAYYNEIAYFLGCVQEARPPRRCMPQSTRDSLALAVQERALIGAKGEM